jgi:hypothetical protein
MNEDHFGLDKIQRSVIVGEGVAAMVTTPEGRDFLIELASRLRPSIMDIPFSDLVRERLRADRLGAIVDTIAKNTKATAADTRTLGEIMPQLPEDVRELLASYIISAGWS